MIQLVSFSELKSGHRLGVSGQFLAMREGNQGWLLIFQSEQSTERFYLRSQREPSPKIFKTLDALQNAVKINGLEACPLKVFGEFSLDNS